MTALDRLGSDLERFGSVVRNASMARRTTFGIGGPADILVTVRTADDLAGAVIAARDAGQPAFVLGSGSNILVADEGIRGVVVDNRARRRDEVARGTERLESGVSLAGFARRACREGLAGLSWAVGIPGTLGGGVAYNAGAYGGCLADVITRARVLAADGRIEWWPAEDLGLMYRESVFTRETLKDRVVLEVELALRPADAGPLLAEAAAYDERRLDAQPRGRSAGSMFKNPPGRPAWKLLDAAGMRGRRRGDAGVSDKHCNFFVNLGQARAADVEALVREAESRVLEKFGIRLEREVSFVGDWR